MRWKPRKDAPLASSENLALNRAAVAAEIAALESELAEISAAMPELVFDPEHAAEAEARSRELEALLPHKRRTLAAIEGAIPDARRREKLAEIEQKRADLEFRTAKQSRGIEERYNRAASAYAAVLQEMADNVREWAGLRRLASLEVNVKIASQDVETRLRPRNPLGYLGTASSLHKETRVEAWDGSILFDGEKQ